MCWRRSTRVACEDTRHTQQLLRAYGIERPCRQLLALHQHNEAEAAVAVIGHLRHGLRGLRVRRRHACRQRPGARLVAAVRDAGLPVVPLPAPAASLRCSAPRA